MPLYEYHCESCDRRFEKIVKFSDPPLETCPTCGGGPVRKLMSSPAFHLKGTGWYATDYAKKDHAPAGKTESSRDAQEVKDGKGSRVGNDSKDKPETQSAANSDGKTDKTSTTETTSSSTAAAPHATPKSSKSAG